MKLQSESGGIDNPTLEDIDKLLAIIDGGANDFICLQDDANSSFIQACKEDDGFNIQCSIDGNFFDLERKDHPLDELGGIFGMFLLRDNSKLMDIGNWVKNDEFSDSYVQGGENLPPKGVDLKGAAGYNYLADHGFYILDVKVKKGFFGGDPYNVDAFDAADFIKFVNYESEEVVINTDFPAKSQKGMSIIINQFLDKQFDGLGIPEDKNLFLYALIVFYALEKGTSTKSQGEMLNKALEYFSAYLPG